MSLPPHIDRALAGLGIAGDGLHLRVWANSDAEHGAQQFAVADRLGVRVLLTRARSESARRALADRHGALHHALAAVAIGSLRARIAAPRPIEVGDETWLWRPWIAGRNGTVDGRRPFAGHRLLAQLRAALDLAVALADGERTIVAYDLCPDNTVVSADGTSFVDFEYWDHGPAIDNVFDAILGWGCVIGLRPWQRQGDALAVWTAPDRALVATVAGHRAVALLRAVGPTALREAFARFVAIKAARQGRVYGREHAFARRWQAIHGAWRALRAGPESPWLALA